MEGYKPDVAEARKYWDAFWSQQAIDRPALCVTAPRRGRARPASGWTPVKSCHACMSGEYLPLLEEAERLMESTFYGGEAMPSFEVTLGPDQFAAFLGARLEAREGHFTTWACPVLDELEGFAAAIDEAEDGYFARLRAFLEAARDYAGGRFLISQLDLHSNIDSLSALRGPQNLCMDIMDEPEEVRRVVDAIDGLYPRVLDMAWEAAGMAKAGSIGWAPTYCEHGRFAVVQCDFSCMLGPAQAREFVIPSIRREVECLDHCVYHYDGKEALGHLEDILAIEGIDCVQWVPGDGNPRSIEWMDLLHRIQAAGKSLWIYDWTAEEIAARHRELDPEKVVFSLDVESQDEAERLLERVRL